MSEQGDTEPERMDDPNREAVGLPPIGADEPEGEAEPKSEPDTEPEPDEDNE